MPEERLAELIQWVYERQERGIHPGLGRVQCLLDLLGRPQDGPDFVQVAGTNGKGSVTRFLSSILRAAGWTPVGEYTSPHLHRFVERIQVNGEPVGEAALTTVLDRVRSADASVEATFFELVTAAAFVAFRDACVRWGVLEVGLGGRLDATSVAPTRASIITGVALDHTAILGDTIAAIAGEKAGIIRPGVPVITGATGTALTVIAARAEALSAPLVVAGRDFGVQVNFHGWGGSTLQLERPGRDTLTLRVPMLGEHAARNAALAAMTAEMLGAPCEAIASGLNSARWPGRLELLPGRPRVLLDAAHNPDGARSLVAFLRKVGEEQVAFVVGGMQDKDLPGVAAVLSPLTSRTFTVSPAATPRAASAEALAGFYPRSRAMQSIPAALEAARSAAGPDGLVVVTGTIPLVAQAREELLGVPGERRDRWQ